MSLCVILHALNIYFNVIIFEGESFIKTDPEHSPLILLVFEYRSVDREITKDLSLNKHRFANKYLPFKWNKWNEMNEICLYFKRIFCTLHQTFKVFIVFFPILFTWKESYCTTLTEIKYTFVTVPGSWKRDFSLKR